MIPEYSLMIHKCYVAVDNYFEIIYNLKTCIWLNTVFETLSNKHDKTAGNVGE